MADLSLSGLSTGMDTQAIIEQLVELERQPIYKAEKEISELNVIKDVWRDINSRIDSLENQLTDLKLSSTFNSNTASSSDETVATATSDTSASESVYDLTITNLAEVHRVSSDKQVDTSTSLNLSGDIGINGKTITIDETDTLNDIMDKINGTEDLNVEASIIDNNLVLQSSKTGITNQLTFTDNDNILENLGVLDTNKNIKNELQAAEDAELNINGIDITSSDNNIENVVEGVNFQIKESGTAQITVNKDTEKASQAVQSFVDQYNSVMDFIDTKLDYDPEEDKAGALQGDGTLTRLQSRLRSLVTDTVENSSDYNQLAMVGVSIDRDGVMSLDSSKFTEALEQAPEDVMNLFNAKKAEEGFDGVAVRLDNYVDQLIQTNNGTIPRQIEYYDNRVESLNEDIEGYERQVKQVRERYIEEFTAMEEAISNMQSQQNWMMSQLQNLGGSTSMLNSMM